MKIDAIMTHDPATCRFDATLADAARIMWEADVGCLPIVDAKGFPIAMVTDRDICMAAYTQGRALAASHVSSAMSRRLVSVTESTTLGEVEDLMRMNQIRRVAVVDVTGRLVGIVTLGDIARHSETSLLRKPLEGLGVVRTLASIVERRSAAMPSGGNLA
jgi:CBS domain-containing protein